MKNIFFLFLGLFICLNTQAQFNERPILNLQNEDEAPLNWGYFLGFNSFDFKFDYVDVPRDGDHLVSTSTGFNVGLISELRLNQFFDLRFEPGLFYTQRTIGFRGFTTENEAIRDVKSTYINFPLLLKASTKRIGNWKPYIVGGLSYSLNLGSNEDSLDDNSSGTFRMTKNNYNWEVGFGIDFYTEYFKFSPSIRGVFAINNELVPDNDPDSPWTGNLSGIRTRGVFVNFTFE
ncbi:PorT family protein [Cellulophaga sp. E16_2]|uniref:Probable protein-translocating porin PorT n=1 Tax=Cellulophaga algicola (strain DSM 14237 / IC166 / ACAM 630) TaxID=688270 RepID=E6X6K2_CELAD|nr:MULTISPECIES: porin family protein [Cellulophaga]ADV49540.1 probable protein-translocating porin PorT [Cellulophaga algicola DSM 14237]MBO0591992.1 PorT family protein [Cellulophaga sp. E16_2]